MSGTMHAPAFAATGCKMPDAHIRRKTFLIAFLDDATPVVPFDNAMAESFFTTLECERLDRTHFQDPHQSRRANFEFIEGV